MSAQLNVAASNHNILKPLNCAYLYYGEVTAVDEAQNQWGIDDSYQAGTAIGLMVTPCVGDQVSFIEYNGSYCITQVLYRMDTTKALKFESQFDIEMKAPNLRFTALNEMDLLSLNRLSLMSKDGLLSMGNSLITLAENMVQKARQLSLHAKGMMHIDAKHQVITADEDIRVDAKRINMG